MWKNIVLIFWNCKTFSFVRPSLWFIIDSFYIALFLLLLIFLFLFACFYLQQLPAENCLWRSSIKIHFFPHFFPLAVSGVIEYLWYGQTIMLRQTRSALHVGGLMGWSLWPIHFVCHAGKLDSLFPDDSYIDMGEIDVGRKVAQQIPPGIFWRSQVFIDHPMYLKFNVSLSKDALVGIYGRRGLPPSHTQVRRISTNHLDWRCRLNSLNWIPRALYHKSLLV